MAKVFRAPLDSNANDFIGSNNWTIVGSCPSVPAKRGNGYSIVNSWPVSNYINFGTGLNSYFSKTSPFSLQLIIKVTDVSAFQELFGNVGTTGSKLCVRFDWVHPDRKFRFAMFDRSNPSDLFRVENDTAQNYDVFNHIIITYDGGWDASGINIFVNWEVNNNVTDNSLPNGLSDSDDDFSIWFDNDAPVLGTCNAVFDEFIMRDHELTHAEAKTLYSFYFWHF